MEDNQEKNKIFLKQGKVVIILQGRYAGRKAVILKAYSEGKNAERPYGHALVAGIDRYPRKVTRRMSKKKVARRTNLKSFVKIVNYNHLMPTRYSLSDVKEFKNKINPDQAVKEGNRDDANKDVRAIFQARYNAGKNPWFFKKLRF
eukprot:TRINITY_DN85828_c0_g1_i1.p1 TRINITY_DN85828_c0_g1~~TRINITY_DN85828_c0_g1_i1.p1  ORF type:complete len:146 (+),score=35.64 TRINITY_DN85828_c0_g1_i1:58-495(+)